MARLTLDDITLEDEILEMDGGRLNFYISCGFTLTESDGFDYDSWSNAYADYDMASGQVCDELEITVVSKDKETTRRYTLSDREKEVLLEKMEAYCLSRNGVSLSELSKELSQGEKNDAHSIEIRWDDLTPEKQQEILDAFGDNCNFDVVPIATIPVAPEERQCQELQM